MSDYIKREDALNAFGRVYMIPGRGTTKEIYAKQIENTYKQIESIPCADVVERKRGKWLITDRYHDFMDGTELTIWKCSECGDEFSLEGERPTKKYCSNCGARMDGDDDV